MSKLHVLDEFTWSKADVSQATEDFKNMILRCFGEVYTPLSDGGWKGIAVDVTHPIGVLSSTWRVCQAVKHKLVQKVFGKVELREGGTRLRLILFYDEVDKAEKFGT